MLREAGLWGWCCALWLKWEAKEFSGLQIHYLNPASCEYCSIISQNLKCCQHFQESVTLGSDETSCKCQLQISLQSAGRLISSFLYHQFIFFFCLPGVIFLQLQVNPLIASTKQHYFIIGRDKRIGWHSLEVLNVRRKLKWKEIQSVPGLDGNLGPKWGRYRNESQHLNRMWVWLSYTQQSVGGNKGLCQIFLRYWKLLHQPRQKSSESLLTAGHSVAFSPLLGTCQWMMWAVLHNSSWISTVGQSPVLKPPVWPAPAP